MERSSVFRHSSAIAHAMLEQCKGCCQADGKCSLCMGEVCLQIDTPPQISQRGGFADETKLLVMTRILILNAPEIFTTTSPLLLSHAALHCASSKASPSFDCANSLGSHGVLTPSTLVLSASLEHVGGVLLERFVEPYYMTTSSIQEKHSRCWE